MSGYVIAEGPEHFFAPPPLLAPFADLYWSMRRVTRHGPTLLDWGSKAQKTLPKTKGEVLTFEGLCREAAANEDDLCDEIIQRSIISPSFVPSLSGPYFVFPGRP